MKVSNSEYVKITKTKEEVETYLARLKYALSLESTLINFQRNRKVDLQRPIEYSNSYTVAELFPDESPKDALRRELGNLKVNEYMETVKDTRFPKCADLWIFGKKFNLKDTYIKFRVEIVGRNNVFVMSFHFSTKPFVEGDFPFSDS